MHARLLPLQSLSPGQQFLLPHAHKGVHACTRFQAYSHELVRWMCLLPRAISQPWAAAPTPAHARTGAHACRHTV
eukprot:1160545-Pelagomonas_calceolata.AAC.20